MSAAEQSGTLIAVNSSRVAVQITGAGTPAVVLLSSAGGGHDQWAPLREHLTGAVCLSYGRPGIDGSDPLSPEEAGQLRTVEWAAEHLHHVLEAARLPAPYVLVGCSIGGWIADRFAALWPEQVAGLVQIDPTMLTAIPRMVQRGPIDDAEGAGILLPRAGGRQELLAHPPSRPQRAVVVSRAFGTVSADVIARYWTPLTVEEADHGWRACQRDWSQRLGAVHIVADHAGHHVQIDQPELIRYVLDCVTRAARTETDLSLDAEGIRDAGGWLLEARP